MTNFLHPVLAGRHWLVDSCYRYSYAEHTSSLPHHDDVEKGKLLFYISPSPSESLLPPFPNPPSTYHHISHLSNVPRLSTLVLASLVCTQRGLLSGFPVNLLVGIRNKTEFTELHETNDTVSMEVVMSSLLGLVSSLSFAG